MVTGNSGSNSGNSGIVGIAADGSAVFHAAEN